MQISQCTMKVLVFLMTNTVLTTSMYLKDGQDSWLTSGASNIGTQNPGLFMDQIDQLELTLAPPSHRTIKELTPFKEPSMSSIWGVCKETSSKHLSKGKTDIMYNQYHELGPKKMVLTHHKLAQMSSAKPTSETHSVGPHMLSKIEFHDKKRPIQKVHEVGSGILQNSKGQLKILPQNKKMKLNSTQDFGMSLRYSNDMTHEQDLLRINLAYAPTKPRAMPSEINHSFPQKQVQTHNEEKSKDKKIVSSDQEVHKLPQPDPHELTKFLKTGSDVVQKHPINEEIKSWFSDLRNGILNHHQETCCFGIKGNQIRKALEFAKDRLTATFLGYLMENQQHLGGKKLNTILHDGWEFLKGYMNGWRKLNFKEVSLLRKKPNFCSFSPLFPAIEVFVNLMRLKRSNTLSYKLFQRLVIEWQTKLLN